MGCDIHLYIEKRVFAYSDKDKENGFWVCQDKLSENEDFYIEKDYNPPYLFVKREDEFYTHGRNYNLFCALAGVRSYHFIGAPPLVSPPKGMPKDASKIVKKFKREYGSDGHTHSYLTLLELQRFDWSPYGETCNDFRNETMKKMEGIAEPHNVRIVFWFDN